MKTNRTLFFVLIANFGALSYLLQYFRIPLPFLFPSFLEIHFSNVPAIIGGFALGPLAGGLIVLIKFLLQVLFVPSYTGYIGEAIDLILGVATVLVSSLVYQRIKSKKGAITASLFGILTWVIVAVGINYLFAIDFYVGLLTYPGQDGLDAILESSKVIPGINRSNYLSKIVFLGILPFNILTSMLTYGITFIIYKRVSSFIVHLNQRFSKETE
jgi:riboflavin transporter FmnP